MTSLDDLKQSLESARAAWTGCDWDTEFGPRRANLKGLTSRQTRLVAQATRGAESEYWREVCGYLDAVENDAASAAQLAQLAVDMWSLGNISQALRRLDDAIALEARYREPVAYPRLRPLLREPDSFADEPDKKIADAG